MREKAFLKEYAGDKYQFEDDFDFSKICDLNATDEDEDDEDAEFEYRYPSNEDFDDYEYYEPEQNYHTFEPQDDKDEDYWNERSYKMHLQRNLAQKTEEPVVQKQKVCSDKEFEDLLNYDIGGNPYVKTSVDKLTEEQMNELLFGEC
jgi:hypothetical protein